MNKSGAGQDERPDDERRREIDDQFKLDVKAALAAKKPKKWSERRLMKELGEKNPSHINTLLKPIAKGGLQYTALAERVSRLLNVPLPHERKRGGNISDERRRKIERVLDLMTDEQLEKAAEFLEMIVPGAKQNR